MLDRLCTRADGSTMKAIVIHQFGGPDVLNAKDVSQPTLAAGEISIKVRAATVNQTLDVALRAGTYARRPCPWRIRNYAAIGIWNGAATRSGQGRQGRAAVGQIVLVAATNMSIAAMSGR